MEQKERFFLECYELGIIKFGKFTLKSGIESPFYVDLRPLASDPKLLKKLTNYLLNLVNTEETDLICGVPYAALPMATAMSLESNLPLIIKRKEAKSYGTKKLIEGLFQSGQTCLLVEDVITSGKSLLETIPEIENEGISIKNIVVVLDRQQGGIELLENKGYKVHALFNITQVCEILGKNNLLSDIEIQKIHEFLKGNKIEFETEKRATYEDKLAKSTNTFSQKLLEIAIEKKSNLIASADILTTQELLNFAEKVGPNIVALKTHIDILTDFDFDTTILPLKDLATKYNFLLMEDRKFADIGNTQELQFTTGIYKISSWADLVTSHVIAGEKSIDCFLNVGVVGILGMSSKGTLTNADYREPALKIMLEHPNVIGAVAQNQIPDDLLLFTPGVNLETDGDGKDQQYRTPEHVFKNLKTDFMIVGRGIYKADDIEKAALDYKIAGWNAYLEEI